MPRGDGKLIEKFPISTPKRKLFVEIRLDSKRSMFFAYLDRDYFEDASIVNLKHALTNSVNQRDTVAYDFYIEYDLNYKGGSITSVNGEGVDIGLHYQLVAASEPINSREERVFNSGAYMGDSGPEIGNGQVYTDFLDRSRIIEYTPQRWRALGEIVAAVKKIDERLREVLNDEDLERVASSLDNIPVSRLLGPRGQ